MYSLRAIFDKQPAIIAGAIRSVLFVLVLAGLVSLGEELLAGIALTAEIVLTLFTVSQSTPKHHPTLAEGTEVKVQGSEDTVVIAASPPGPVGIDDGADDGT